MADKVNFPPKFTARAIIKNPANGEEIAATTNYVLVENLGDDRGPRYDLVTDIQFETLWNALRCAESSFDNERARQLECNLDVLHTDPLPEWARDLGMRKSTLYSMSTGRKPDLRFGSYWINAFGK